MSDSSTLRMAKPHARIAMPAVAIAVVLAVFILVAPLYLDAFWMRTGFAVAGAAVGAIGLNILVGSAGQLSFAHPFFLAAGATTYTALSSGRHEVPGVWGGGLPPALAVVCAVLVSGLLGLCFSPLSSRLRGIYLGVASIAFIFLAQHVLNNWTHISGGFNGRATPAFSLFGFSFGDDQEMVVAGVPFGSAEKLWYLGFAVVAIGLWFARNLTKGSTGWALGAVRDSEILAAVNGIDVRRHKQIAFVVSAMYAGVAGVMLGLAIGSIAAESFDIAMSISFLSMIVIGGLGSVWGSLIGAIFVTALPLVLQQYAASLPLIAATGSTDGLTAASAALYLFGLAIILVMLFEPRGFIGLGSRVKRLVANP